MRHRFTLLATALAVSALAAPSTDRLQSPGCVTAMSALHDVEGAVAASVKSGKGTSAADSRTLVKLAELKRAAARTCLGGNGTPSPAPQHMAQRPISVQVSPSASVTARPALIPSPLPPVPVAPLKSITSCDAAGCWVNNGTRLQRVGPALLSPKGFCSVQGSVLNCP